jgi:hypothetical protein
MKDTARDVLVATQVMGWKVLTPAETEHLDDVSDQMCVLDSHDGLLRYYQVRSNYWELRPWSPTSDIRDAWDVVEKLRLFVGPVPYNDGEWMASPESYWGDFTTESAATAPLAICNAALKAVGARLPENAQDVV